MVWTTQRRTWRGGVVATNEPVDPSPLVFRHDLTQPGGFFTSLAEANNTPAADPATAQKFSRLDEVETMRNANGLLHFRQTYPLAGQVQAPHTGDIVIEWQQASNPFENGTNPGFETVAGFNLISQNVAGEWGGISRSNATATYFDNNPNSPNWWGSIGQITAFSGGTFPAITAPSRTARIVELEVIL